MQRADPFQSEKHAVAQKPGRPFYALRDARAHGCLQAWRFGGGCGAIGSR